MGQQEASFHSCKVNCHADVEFKAAFDDRDLGNRSAAPSRSQMRRI